MSGPEHRAEGSVLDRVRGLSVAALLLAVAVGGALAVPGPGSTPSRAVDPATQQPTPPGPPDYRFVSAPDLLNSDIGDVSGTPGYRRGAPNSINDQISTALDLVHDSIADEAPDDVYVAGDTVEGHWTRDRSGRDYFRRAPGAPLIRAAGRLYYSQWRQRFASRGLTVHTAVGDHEIGDNPWRRNGGADQRSKWENFGVFKDVYADQLVPRSRYGSRPTGQANRTAYATRLDPEVLLVTLDVFRRTRNDVVAEVDAQQLRWLDRVLGRARADGVDWVVVQGHVPILTPVRERASSGMSYRGGAGSELWRVMRRHDVDLYLSGEVHDVTVKRRDGITQVSHGGIFGPLTSYLVGDVTGGLMQLELREFRGARSSRQGDLWGLDPRKAQPRVMSLAGPRTTGTLTLGSDQRLLDSAGRLAPGLG